MFIPFISQRSRRSRRSRRSPCPGCPERARIQPRGQHDNGQIGTIRIEPRKGGGGGGRGGGGGGGKSSSGSSSSGKSSGKGSSGGSSSGKSGGSDSDDGGDSSSGKSGGSSSSGSSSKSSGKSGSSKSSPINTNTNYGQRPAAVYGGGGGSVVQIPSGHPFAGRPAGGGRRNQIFGTGVYGSGYPGIYGRGTIGRGFPFYFWPVVWWGGPSYLHPTEYDQPTNTSRPGGPLVTAVFTNTSSDLTTTTLRVLSDNATVTELIPQLITSCVSYIQSSSNITAQPYSNDSSSLPKPEQAIQYYRASSIVLSLDDYNNTVTLTAGNDTNTTDATTNTTIPNIPLPTNINLDFVNCMNSTIGSAAPLVSSGVSSSLILPSPLFRLALVLCVLMLL